MPFYLFLQPSRTTRIAIWKNNSAVEDNFTELAFALSPRDQERYASIRHPLKKKEFLSARAAFAALGESPALLSYSEKGKPEFPHGFVSLSHNHDYGAAIISLENPVGIDVERLDRQVARVRHKFVHQEEEEVAQTLSDLFIWVAKEAAYKMYGRKELDFRNDIRISMQPNRSLKASVNNGSENLMGNLFHIRGEHSLMCWCIASALE